MDEDENPAAEEDLLQDEGQTPEDDAAGDTEEVDPELEGQEGGDGEGDEGTDVGESDPEPASRGRADRVSEAIRRAEAAERTSQDLARQLREIQNSQQERNAALTAQERQAKIDRMTPEERLSFMAEEAMHRVNAESQRAAFINADAADRADFLRKIASNKNLAALQDDVEKRLTDLRTQNKQNLPREVLLKYVLGEMAFNAAMKGPAKKQVQRGRDNINRARTAPTHARGTMNGTNRRAGVSLKEKLSGVKF